MTPFGPFARTVQLLPRAQRGPWRRLRRALFHVAVKIDGRLPHRAEWEDSAIYRDLKFCARAACRLHRWPVPSPLQERW